MRPGIKIFRALLPSLKQGCGMLGHWRRWHRWLGLGSGVILGWVALTGMLLGLEHWITRAFWGAPETNQTMRLEDWEGEIRRWLVENGKAEDLAIEDWRIWSQAEEAGKPAWVEVTFSEGSPVFLHAGNLKAGRLTSSRLAFFDWIETLHKELAAGVVGKWLVLGATVVLVLLLFTGLYLAWRTGRPHRRKQVERSGRSLWLNRHAVVGYLFFAPLGLLAVTGLIMGIPVVSDLLRGQAHNRHLAPMLEEAPVSYLPWVEILRAAERELPPWQEIRLHAPASPLGGWRVEAVPFGATHRQGRDRVWIHPATADVMKVAFHRDMPFAYRTRAVALALHDGSFGGSVGRILMLLSSVALFFLVYSGYLLERRKRTKTTQTKTSQTS